MRERERDNIFCKYNGYRDSLQIDNDNGLFVFVYLAFAKKNVCFFAVYSLNSTLSIIFSILPLWQQEHTLLYSKLHYCPPIIIIIIIVFYYILILCLHLNCSFSLFVHLFVWWCGPGGSLELYWGRLVKWRDFIFFQFICKILLAPKTWFLYTTYFTTYKTKFCKKNCKR